MKDADKHEASSRVPPAPRQRGNTLEYGGDMASVDQPARPVALDRIFGSVAIFTVVTSVIGLASALCGVFHAPQALLLSLLITGLYVWKAPIGAALDSKAAPRWLHVGLLLAVTLFFRLPVYNYVLGGQDEGLYTNIAQSIERTGGIAVHDPSAEQLKGSPYLERYLGENRFHDVWGNPYLLGVYSDAHDPAKLEFQFYHLFPVWMALFAGLFGSTFGVYALTFFALLSTLFLYRLALILTNSQGAALMAGMLLALSPLHAFFSKFPVTEVPALAFTLMGFAYVAAYWSRGSSGTQDWHWLVWSALAFGCMFVTRMSGFTYMPFFVVAALASRVCDPDRKRSRNLQLWAAGVVAVFLASAWYGFHWAYQTVIYNYGEWFRPYLGPHWLRNVLLLVLVGLAGWALLTWWLARRGPLRELTSRRVLMPLRRLLGPLAVVVIVVGGYRVYGLGWTHAYSGTGLDTVYHLAGAGWAGAIATSLPQLAIFLGPLLVIAFLLAMLVQWKDSRIELLRLFLLFFLAYSMLLRWVLPYNPYYARFLLSNELAPYVMLFVVCVWCALRHQRSIHRALTVCLVLTLGYSGVLSAAQIGKNEQSGLYASLARLLAPTGPGDIILLDMHDAGVLKTPLVYTFGRQVVTVDQSDLNDAGYVAALATGHDNTWLITPARSAPEAFSRVATVRYKVVEFRHDHWAPMHLETSRDTPLFLYDLMAPKVPVGVDEPLRAGSPWLGWFTKGWSSAEGWGIWSQAPMAELRIDPRSLPVSKNGVTLSLQAQGFVGSGHPCQRVDVRIDGQRAGSYRPCYPAGQFTMSLPLSVQLLESDRAITVTFDLPDARSPESLGLGRDSRILGMALTGVKVAPQAAGD